MRWETWAALALIGSEALQWVYRIGKPRPVITPRVGMLGLVEWGGLATLIIIGAHHG